jgi:hypothetical protein
MSCGVFQKLVADVRRRILASKAPLQVCGCLSSAKHRMNTSSFRTLLGGQKVTKTFDGYAPSVQPAPAFVLGTVAPRDGKFTLRIEVAGANPASKGAKYFWGLDCVVLEKP